MNIMMHTNKLMLATTATVAIIGINEDLAFCSELVGPVIIRFIKLKKLLRTYLQLLTWAC